jgi:hypothetical protein
VVVSPVVVVLAGSDPVAATLVVAVLAQLSTNSGCEAESVDRNSTNKSQET